MPHGTCTIKSPAFRVKPDAPPPAGGLCKYKNRGSLSDSSESDAEGPRHWLPRDDPRSCKAASRVSLSVSGPSPQMGTLLPGPRAGLVRVSTPAVTREPLSVLGHSPRMGLSGLTAVDNQVNYSTAAIRTGSRPQTPLRVRCVPADGFVWPHGGR